MGKGKKSRSMKEHATGVKEGEHRHQAIAERVRADSQNSQRGAVGFGAEPQYNNRHQAIAEPGQGWNV